MIRKIGYLCVVLIALVGCSSPAQVLSGGRSSDTGESSSVGDPSQSGSPATARIGDTVKIGDWEVKITKVTKNANSLIKRANMFNDKPKGQYVLVDYKAKYVGEERKADSLFDLSWSLTDSSQNVLDQAAAVTPADKADKTTEARKGGTISQQVVFDVRPKKIAGSILSVENLSDYADFKLS